METAVKPCTFDGLFGQDDQDIELNERLDAPLGPMAATKRLLQDGGASRRRDCPSAAPSSFFSRRFNVDGEGASAK